MTENDKIFEIWWDTIQKPIDFGFMTIDQLRAWSLTTWIKAIEITTKLRASKAGKAGTGDSKRRPESQAKSIAAMTAARKAKARLRKEQGG